MGFNKMIIFKHSISLLNTRHIFFFNICPLQKVENCKKKGYNTEPRKGHFCSIFTRKEIETKRVRKEIKNNNITFKQLLIFPFQYIAEKKSKQEYWKGNQNKNICVCIPILVTTFPEWLSGTEPSPHTHGAVRPSSLCFTTLYCLACTCTVLPV